MKTEAAIPLVDTSAFKKAPKESVGDYPPPDYHGEHDRQH